MLAEPQPCPEDVELLARALYEAEYRTPDELTWDRIDPIAADSYRRVATKQLAALASAGRLVPAGAYPVWAVDHPGLGILGYDTEADARLAAGTAGTLLRATGPWIATR